MNEFRIESDGILYTDNMARWNQDTPLGYYPRIIDAANALLALRDQFDKAQSVEDELTKFHDGIYPLAIVLEIDGEPMGTVRIVEDFVAWVPFKDSRHE